MQEPGFPWSELGIAPTSEAREVQRAYARRLRALDVDKEPMAFKTLRSAYEAALAEIAGAAGERGRQQVEANPPPLNAEETPHQPSGRDAAVVAEFSARGRGGDVAGALAAVDTSLREEALAIEQQADLEARLFLAVYDDPDMPVALLAGLAERFHWNEIGSGLEQYQPDLYGRYLHRLSSASEWLQWLRHWGTPQPITLKGILRALGQGGHITRAGVAPSHNAWLLLRRFRPWHARLGVIPWNRDELDSMLRDARRFGPLLGEAIDPRTVEFLWGSLKQQQVARRQSRKLGRSMLYAAVACFLAVVAVAAYFGPWQRGGSIGPPGARQMLELNKDRWAVLRRFDGKVIVYFSELMGDRSAIAEIRYGIDLETPDRAFDFPAFDGPGLAPISAELRIYVEAPATTRFVTVQLRFKDGTYSPIRRYDKIGSD